MKIVILQDRGIYKEGQEVDLTGAHAEQWILSGYAELALPRSKPEPKTKKSKDVKSS